MKRVLYVQYTNPAGYPPLQRSALLLARAGCEVTFAGIAATGTQDMTMRTEGRMRVETLGGVSGGPLGPAKYARYLGRLAWLARGFRPDWCYASELLAAPAALMVRQLTGARVVYHEHDAPGAAGSAFTRAALRARARLASSAEIVIVPADQRRALLPAPAAQRARIVWNCPLREEVAAAVPAHTETIKLVYAGSLSPDLLPLSYLDALAQLPAHVSLDVFGYYTNGQERYAAAWQARMRAPDVAGRVRMNGVVPHSQLLDSLSSCDIGIATILNSSGNINLNAMAGASNKAFNYMARGLPFLVSNTAEWRRLFVEPGYAVACEPAVPAAIAAAVRTLLDAPRREMMGSHAQSRILAEWNYQTQFAPVLEEMLA